MEYDKRYKPSCSARTADGLLRGTLVGLAWGIYLPSPVSFSFESLKQKSGLEAREADGKPLVGKNLKKEIRMYSHAKTNEFNIFTGWRFKPGTFFTLERVYTSKVIIKNQLKQMAIASTPTLKNMGFSSLAFAGFLGTFSGITCASESLTGKGSGHPINVFIGGCTAGLLLTAGIRRPSKDLILTTSLGTGLLTTAIHMLVS